VQKMIFAIYKKRGPTSRDVLNTIKKKTGEKKIGHAGTLDPLAEGVLVIGVGRESTKKLHTERFKEKEYLAVIFLGEESNTDDSEGEKKKILSRKPSFDEVVDVVSRFQGVIEQAPPAFSAVKINGERAYKRARRGEAVRPEKRKADVKEITVLSYRYPSLKIKVTTGRGVYIRSLARDIGRELRTGGYLCSLLRTRVGEFQIEDCIELETLCDTIKKIKSNNKKTWSLFF